MQDDLKQIQRKIYMSYFQDGLWDILLGVFLLGWGLMVTHDFVAVMGGIWVAIYFIVLGLKRLLVYPRAGYIKIAEAHRQQIRMVILGVVLLILGLAVFLSFMGGSRPAWFEDYFMFLFGCMVAISVTFLGYWWRVVRWYVYAVIIILAFAAHQWLEVELNLSFFIPGGIIAAWGIILLLLFLRRYPRNSTEDVEIGS